MGTEDVFLWEKVCENRADCVELWKKCEEKTMKKRKLGLLVRLLLGILAGMILGALGGLLGIEDTAVLTGVVRILVTLKTQLSALL